MFALAILDEDRQRLLLARDRAGKKPLYYRATPAAFVFGSEMKALFADPAAPREVNLEAIPLYFTFGYVPYPETLYQGILQVPPVS